MIKDKEPRLKLSKPVKENYSGNWKPEKENHSVNWKPSTIKGKKMIPLLVTKKQLMISYKRLSGPFDGEISR
jgi:hypothetical protein